MAPLIDVLGRGHIVTADPGEPFGDLGLVLPGFFGHDVEGVFDIDAKVEGIFAAHVGVVDVDDDGSYVGRGFCFVVGIFGSESVRDVDHVSGFADGFGDGDVIDVDAGEGIVGNGRAKKVIGFKGADAFPEAGHEVTGDLEAGFARGFSVGEEELFEFVLADAGGGELLL